MASSAAYQPLDLSKSKANIQTTNSDSSDQITISRSYNPFMLQHRPGLHFSNPVHKPKSKKDIDCNLSWSSTFGTAIPTTTIPPNLLSLHHKNGFVYVPPPPGVFQAEDKVTSTEGGISRPVPSKVFSHYGIPLPPSSLTTTDMESAIHKLSVSAPEYCCCSGVRGIAGFDPSRHISDYFTPAFMFRNNYSIDSLNAIAPLRREYMFPSDQTTGMSKAYPYTTTEHFYNHVPNKYIPHDSMNYRSKDVCELWKYEGDRIGFLPSNGSRPKQLKRTDSEIQSSERSVTIDESEEEDTIMERKSVSDKDHSEEPSFEKTKQECSTSNDSNTSVKSSEDEGERAKVKTKTSGYYSAHEVSTNVSMTESCNSLPTSPALATNSNESIRPGPVDMFINREALDKNVIIECSNSGQTNQLRPKSKDSIGPGYIEMIAKAILNSKSKRCMLTDIYKYISTTYSRYRDDTVCWRNIVRHHLSHYECFVKAEHNGHAHYWTINPDMEQDFANGKFHRKRRPNRRKRTIPSSKIIASKSSTLDSVTSPIANWFPSTFHPYCRNELTKPYIFFQGQHWLNEDQMRSCYPYATYGDPSMARYPLEKNYR